MIAITLSGETAEVLESIRIAKSRGASIICITAVSGSSVAKESQEVIQVAALKNLDTGTKISPQFSILAIMDVLYSYYFANDSYFKTQKYKAIKFAQTKTLRTEALSVCTLIFRFPAGFGTLCFRTGCRASQGLSPQPLLISRYSVVF